jgi:hypothetical protein
MIHSASSGRAGRIRTAALLALLPLLMTLYRRLEAEIGVVG